MREQIAVLPAKWVKLPIFEAMTGYTPNAVHCKRKAGEWEEGVIWRKAPDGNILINWREYEKWAEGDKAA